MDSYEQVNKRDGAGRAWRRDAMTVALVALPLLAVALLGAVIVTRVESTLREQVVQSLETTLRATHETMRIWVNERKQRLQHIAEDHGLQALVGSTLRALPKQSRPAVPAVGIEARKRLEQTLRGHGDWPYFIVGPDSKRIASNRPDSNAVELIFRRRPDLITRLFDGDAVLVPPLAPEPGSDGRAGDAPPSMFAAAPITNADGSVLAALIIRIDPLLTFSDVAHIGRIGRSGETYFFDRQARMLTASRFTDQLRKIGLIPDDASSVLNVTIRDPGVDLTAGETPAVPLAQRPVTKMVRAAIARHGGHSASGYRDYRGVRVLGAWLWDEQLGIGLTTEINEKEALATYYVTRDLFMSALALTVAIAGATLAGLLTLRRRTARQIETLAMFPDKNPMPVLRIDRPWTVGYANTPALPFLERLRDANGNLALLEWRDMAARIFRDGRHRSLEIEHHGAVYSFVLTPLPASDIIYAYGQDVTQQKWAEGHLRELSIRDSLTGLANRRHFDEFLDQQWRRLMRGNARIALLFIDIDHFKRYNDRYGHQAGDACLKRIAAEIAATSRRAGDLAARYGGEEFVVVLSMVAIDAARQAAETLREAIENLAIPHEDSTAAKYVTVSIGLACTVPKATLSTSDLVEAADKALYRAKSHGRNRTEYVMLDADSAQPPDARTPASGLSQ